MKNIKYVHVQNIFSNIFPITTNNAFITGGQFIAACIDGFFAKTPEGWRYMLGIGAIPSIIMLVGFLFFLPESPRWTLQKGDSEKSKEILQKIRAEKYDEQEFDNLKQDLENNVEKGLLKNLQCKLFRRALVVGCGLQLFQQLGGINTVMYYSASIMEMSGIRDPSLAIWMAAVTAFVNFIFTFVGLYCVEKFGRRKLTFTSQFGVVLTLFMLSVGFFVSSNHSDMIDPEMNPYYLGQNQNQNLTEIDPFECYSYDDCTSCQINPNCGYCYSDLSEGQTISDLINFCLPIDESDQARIDDTERAITGNMCSNGTQTEKNIWWTQSYCPSKYSWMSLAGMVLYLMAFAPGMGPMPWTLNAEIYPEAGRSLGNSISTTTNWITNFIVSLTFLDIVESFTTSGAFLFYSGLSVFGWFFMFFLVPETKGVPLERIPELFEDGVVQVKVEGLKVTTKQIDLKNSYSEFDKEKEHNQIK